MTYLLAGDIGGTNTRLRLVAAATPEIVTFEHEYRSQAYPDLVPIVTEFLSTAQTKLGIELKVTNACFGIAGPVKHRISTLTNLNWHLPANRLQQELDIPQVELINDFVAIGYGIPHLPPSDLYTLQTGIPQANAPKASIGAGTGLGEGILIHNGQDYQVIATEGGHADFAARTEREFEFFRYLCRQQRTDRLSYDRVVSGYGIVAMYQFLRDTSNLSENPDIAAVVKLWERNIDPLADAAAKISEAAIAQTDALSQGTMEMFISIYAGEARNLALKILPDGGLYLAGGIAAKNLPLFTDGIFTTGFNPKGRMSDLLGNIPIYVILNPHVGLIGATNRAANNAGCNRSD